MDTTLEVLCTECGDAVSKNRADAKFTTCGSARCDRKEETKKTARKTIARVKGSRRKEVKAKNASYNNPLPAQRPTYVQGGETSYGNVLGSKATPGEADTAEQPEPVKVTNSNITTDVHMSKLSGTDDVLKNLRRVTTPDGRLLIPSVIDDLPLKDQRFPSAGKVDLYDIVPYSVHVAREHLKSMLYDLTNSSRDAHVSYEDLPDVMKEISEDAWASHHELDRLVDVKLAMKRLDRIENVRKSIEDPIGFAKSKWDTELAKPNLSPMQRENAQWAAKTLDSLIQIKQLKADWENNRLDYEAKRAAERNRKVVKQ